MSHARQTKSLSDLPKTLAKVFAVHLHLLGLTPEDKEELEVVGFVKRLFHQTLDCVIHKELESMRLKFSLVTLKKDLIEECVHFIKRQKSEDILEYFRSELIDKAVKEKNLQGAISVLQIGRHNAFHLLDRPDLQMKSKTAWGKLIKEAQDKKSFCESVYHFNFNASGNYLAVALVPVLLYQLLKLPWAADEADVKDTVVKAWLSLIFIAFAVLISRINPFPVHEVKMSADLSSLDEFLRAKGDRFIREYYEKRKKELGEVKKLTPVRTHATQSEFPEEPKKVGVVKRNRQPFILPLETTDKPVEQKQMVIEDGQGNVYYRLNTKNPNTFFRLNKKEVLAMIVKSKLYDAKEDEIVLGRFVTAVSTQKFNKGHTLTVVTKSEKKSRGLKHPLKVRIAKNAQLWCCDETGPRAGKEGFELDQGIEEVVSPRAVLPHVKKTK